MATALSKPTPKTSRKKETMTCVTNDFPTPPEPASGGRGGSHQRMYSLRTECAACEDGALTCVEHVGAAAARELDDTARIGRR